MRRAVPIVFLVLAFAGCKRTLHWKAIEDQLADSLRQHAPASVAISVSCPETEVEAGLKFVCHASASDGSSLDLEVELKDTAGSWASHPVR